MKISPKDIHRTFFRNTFYPKSAFTGFTNSSYLQNGTIVVILCLYDKQLTEWMYEALSWLYPCLVSPMHEDRTYNVRSMRKRVLLTQPMTSWPHALWHYVWHQEHETEKFSLQHRQGEERQGEERGGGGVTFKETHTDPLPASKNPLLEFPEFLKLAPPSGYLWRVFLTQSTTSINK